MHRTHTSDGKKMRGPKKFGHWGKSDGTVETVQNIDDLPQEAKHLRASVVAKRYPDVAKKSRKLRNKVNTPVKSPKYWRSDDDQK